MEKGLLGPNGESGGLTEGRLGERCGGNGRRGGSMSRVGEGKVDLMGGMGGGLLVIRSMVSNDGRGDGGLVVEGGSSSRESRMSLVKCPISSAHILLIFEFLEDFWGVTKKGLRRGGEVNGGGVDLGVSKRLLLEVARDMIGESGGIKVGEVEFEEDPQEEPKEEFEEDPEEDPEEELEAEAEDDVPPPATPPHIDKMDHDLRDEMLFSNVVEHRVTKLENREQEKAGEMDKMKKRLGTLEENYSLVLSDRDQWKKAFLNLQAWVSERLGRGALDACPDVGDDGPVSFGESKPPKPPGSPSSSQ
nr:hypothetical protein [Tanacetum cinerariifolium]